MPWCKVRHIRNHKSWITVNIFIFSLGLAGEEKLISSAKQVASSTAHLLVACKVKAEGDTEATRRLQKAGNAVIRSTDNLVKAAQQAISVEDERCIVLHTRVVGRITDEINAR